MSGDDTCLVGDVPARLRGAGWGWRAQICEGPKTSDQNALRKVQLCECRRKSLPIKFAALLFKPVPSLV